MEVFAFIAVIALVFLLMSSSTEDHCTCDYSGGECDHCYYERRNDAPL